jgi:hypothetical protein
MKSKRREYTKPLPKSIDTPEVRELLADYCHELDEAFEELHKQVVAFAAKCAKEEEGEKTK